MLNKIARIYLRIVELICVLLLIIMLICMCIQVGCRLFTIGQNFTEELARISFCLMCFIGAPLAYAEGSHIAVDMIVDRMPKPGKKAVELFVNAMIFIFSAFCIKSLLTFMGSNIGVTAVSMTWLRMNWIYGAVFSSFICMAVVSVVKFVLVILNRAETMDIHADEKKEEEEVDLGL